MPLGLNHFPQTSQATCELTIALPNEFFAFKSLKLLAFLFVLFYICTEKNKSKLYSLLFTQPFYYMYVGYTGIIEIEFF
jgi:hypothetical protein